VIVARLASAADAVGISDVHVSSWRSAYTGLLPDQAFADRTVDRRLAYWSDLLSAPPRPQCAVWVLQQDDHVIGFASTGPCRDADRSGAGDGELYALYLRAEHWGKGRGRTLAEAALRGMPTTWSSASLWVLAGNERAQRFYESLGFRRDGVAREESFGGQPVTELRLQRALPY